MLRRPLESTLLGSVRVPVHKAREIVAGKRRLLLRERVQRQIRVGCDPLAVTLRNRPMLRCTLGRFAPLLPAHSSRTNLVLRLKLNALIFERAMVDPDLVSQLHQTLVRDRGPRRAPTL
jgi:hypothetical protein